jgi:hypothetical protein
MSETIVLTFIVIRILFVIPIFSIIQSFYIILSVCIIRNFITVCDVRICKSLPIADIKLSVVSYILPITFQTDPSLW